MKLSFFSILSLFFIFLISTGVDTIKPTQEFQARAYYFSKSKMELGNWGARLSEAQACLLRLTFTFFSTVIG